MHALKKYSLGIAAAALLAALVAGPERTYDFFFPTPSVPAEWRAVLADVRAFERRIGFHETANFNPEGEAKAGYTLCGYAPRFELPYSYEDPAIRWSDAPTAHACRAAAKDDDVYFTQVEAAGEVGTAMTTDMIRGKLDRFLYLIIHEDCHDQFDFPYGFEEALCNLLAYEGMGVFTRERFGAHSREHRAARTYGEQQAQLTHAVVRYYQQVGALYAQHARGEVAAEALLFQRARMLGAAERTLGWHRGTLNNVGLANEMTYSRHYPLIEAVYEALGDDMRRVVAFFKSVDQRKPAVAALMHMQSLSDAKSVQFVSAHESAVAATVRRMLAETTGTGVPGQLK